MSEYVLASFQTRITGQALLMTSQNQETLPYCSWYRMSKSCMRLLMMRKSREWFLFANSIQYRKLLVLMTPHAEQLQSLVREHLTMSIIHSRCLKNTYLQHSTAVLQLPRSARQGYVQALRRHTNEDCYPPGTEKKGWLAYQDASTGVNMLR